jgi:two-component system KDP operon response regulator KdpE
MPKTTPEPSARILLAEDEPKVIRLLQQVLRATGFAVMTTNSGEHAVEMAALEQPDLVILDIMLTGSIDGFEAARRIRDFSEVPILMLTAKAREVDILKGFEAGTDDYLTKPFSTKELLARVRALLKRARKETSATSDHTMITCGPLQIDTARRQVTRDGEAVHLTRTEYNLLYELARHRNQVMFHEKLLSAVWGPEYRDDVDYLRTFVWQLRLKLEDDPSNPQFIKTEQGVGYIMACPED